MTKVLTLYNDRYRVIAEQTMPAMREFALANCFEFISVAMPSSLSRHPSWHKIPVILERASMEDVIIWLDADVLILDPQRDLSPYFPSDGICFSKDMHGFCAGAFICAGEWFREFFKAVWLLGDPIESTRLHEQDAIDRLFHTFPSIRPHVTSLPETIIQNPDSDYYPHPFAVHFWGNGWKSPARLAEVIAEIKTEWSPAHRNLIRSFS